MWKRFKGLATSVKYVAPEYASNGTMVYGGNTTNANVTGVTEEYMSVRNWNIALGRFITSDDNEDISPVVVLGQTVVENCLAAPTPTRSAKRCA